MFRRKRSSSGPASALTAGLAPDFILPCGPAETVALQDFRGQPGVLAFYPADWSPVCGDQVVLYNEMLDLFAQFNAHLLGKFLQNIPIPGAIRLW